VRKEIEIGRLATVDELTGLYTRREFEDFVRLEFERRRRHGREISVLLLEVDDIADLGENVGKLSRGYVLSEVSSVVTHHLRTVDIGARYTNDSLAMLLPETSREQALIVAGKLQAAVGQRTFLEQSGGISLTVSIGIAAADNKMKTPADLLRAAEHALYEAKTKGFSQARAWRGSPEPEPDEQIAS
jgi:diguanylate cyclase (GGDEF)-like protein